jgi:hypothetical protein
MTNITVSTQVTHETTTTEVIELSPLVQVHRVTTARRSDGEDATSSASESVVYLGDKEDNFGGFYIVKPELLDRIRTCGWFDSNEDYDVISKQPFTDVLEGSPYSVVRIKDYDHTLYDLEGEHLPVAQYFDYLDGRVNDSVFDLKKLLEHLQNRKDVTLLKEEYSNSFVSRVPYYNEGGISGYNFISFIWHPDVEVYRAYRKLINKADYLNRLNKAHTLMGNDQFRVVQSEEEGNE